VYLSCHDVLQPDILFIAAERLGIIQETHIQGAPDLVVEILSPATSDRDRQLKLRLYARHGVREYWIADPVAGSIEVRTRRQGDFELIQTYTGSDFLESPLLEGFRLSLAPTFRKLRH
jgi:Uma2 family endonuclease